MIGAINANHNWLTPRAANPPHRHRHQSDYPSPPSLNKQTTNNTKQITTLQHYPGTGRAGSLSEEREAKSKNWYSV